MIILLIKIIIIVNDNNINIINNLDNIVLFIFTISFYNEKYSRSYRNVYYLLIVVICKVDIFYTYRIPHTCNFIKNIYKIKYKHSTHKNVW